VPLAKQAITSAAPNTKILLEDMMINSPDHERAAPEKALANFG
jgi:hypothetical protein